MGATIDYRRGPSGRGMELPASVVDARAAVLWLRAHADDYRIDRARVGLVGASQGGLIAALAAMEENWFWAGAENTTYSPRVQAVAVFSPLLDLADSSLTPRVTGLVEQALGVSGSANPTRWARHSPQHLVRTPQLRQVGPQLPPFLFLHGTSDEEVPYHQSVAMAAQLRAQGLPAEMFTAPGDGHEFFNAPPWYGPALGALAGFFGRVLADTVTHTNWGDSHPSWSPDGSHIAFDSDFGGKNQIWVMKADGSEPRSLGVVGWGPSWAPDGGRIAFGGHDGRLWMVNADGSGAVHVTRDSTEVIGELSWAPDGASIAYRSWHDNETYVVRISDGSVTRVTDSTGESACRSWSPDGSLIVLHSTRHGKADIYLTSVDGSRLVRVTDTPANEFCPRFSPDGLRIAFQRRVGLAHEHIDIATVRTDGSGDTNLTDHPSNNRYAAWSPDGAWIAFNSTRAGNSDIYVMRADGTELRRLTHR